ncbi:hypothetical protein HLBENOHH_04429 [Aeromonas dhakensis]|uniref:hypothetical protein n=1 Tax=Aeromonas dhakensis TaxID=196024 RepID=UPI00366BF078
MTFRNGYGTAVLSIINNHYRYEIKNRNAITRQRERHINRVFKYMVILPFLFSMLFLLIKNILNDDFVVIAGLFFLTISYVGIIIQNIMMLFVNRSDFIELFSRPFSLIISNTVATVRYESMLYRALMYRSTQEIQYVLNRIKAERNVLSNKISLLIGGIEKIGLFPGLVAMFMSFGQLGNNNVPSWVEPIAYASIALYIFGFLFHNAIIRADERILLLDYIIDLREKQNVNGCI